jgi:hypothetical protein
MDAKDDNNKKFFDTKQYKTVVVGQEGENKANSKSKNNLIALLCDVENKDAREQALKAIKKEPVALELLISAIDDKKLADSKAELISACWESGIDCRPKLNYFVNLAINENYMCCIEALSVILGMDAPVNQDELNKSSKELSSAVQKEKTNKKDLLKQISEILVTLKT